MECLCNWARGSSNESPLIYARRSCLRLRTMPGFGQFSMRKKPDVPFGDWEQSGCIGYESRPWMKLLTDPRQKGGCSSIVEEGSNLRHAFPTSSVCWPVSGARRNWAPESQCFSGLDIWRPSVCKRLPDREVKSRWGFPLFRIKINECVARGFCPNRELDSRPRTLWPYPMDAQESTSLASHVEIIVEFHIRPISELQHCTKKAPPIELPSLWGTWLQAKSLVPWEMLSQRLSRPICAYLWHCPGCKERKAKDHCMYAWLITFNSASAIKSHQSAQSKRITGFFVMQVICILRCH